MPRHAPYHLGTLTAGSLVADPVNAASAYTETREYTVTIPGVANAVVQLARKDATGTKRGVILFGSGSAGKNWSCDTTSSEAWIDTLVAAGWEVIQSQWTPTGWLDGTVNGNEGIARLAGRVASLVKWVYDNRISGSQKLILVGQSAGGTAMAMALGLYQLTPLVHRFVAGGGPPHADLVTGCTTSNATYRYEAGQAAQVDDAWNSDAVVESCEAMDGVRKAQFGYDQLLNQPLTFPTTMYLWGVSDTTVAPAHAELIAAKQPTSKAFRHYIEDTLHSIEASTKGQEAIGNAINERPIIRQADNDNNATSTTSITLTLPKPVVAGNLLVACHRANEVSSTLTGPADWTKAGSQDASGSSGMAVWYKVATGGEEAGATFGSSGAVVHGGAIYEVAFPNASWALDQVDYTLKTNAATITAGPTGTPIEAVEWCVAFVAMSASHGGQVGDWTNGYVAHATVDNRMLVGAKSIDAAAAQETTATWTTSRNVAAMLVTFAP